jgi:hypothetical protein
MGMTDIDADAQVGLNWIITYFIEDEIKCPQGVSPVFKDKLHSRLSRRFCQSLYCGKIRSRRRVVEPKAFSMKNEGTSVDCLTKPNLVSQSVWVPSPELVACMHGNKWCLIADLPKTFDALRARL